MTSLHILAALTVLAAAWTMRSLYLDARRHQRRADRLRVSLADVRAERDQLLDILDDNVDDMRRMAQERHPASRQYGGGNLRLIAGGE